MRRRSVLSDLMPFQVLDQVSTVNPSPPDYALNKAILPLDADLLQALQTLEEGGIQIAFSVDAEGKLEGLLTDGDVRRALVRGASLDSPVSPFLQRSFIKVPPKAGRAETLDLMQALVIGQVPVVDEDGRLQGLHLLGSLLSRAKRPNEAVLLVGGKGARLRPLTNHLPKPMIKVAGRPILERIVLHLAGHGIQRIYLATNYLSHIVQDHFGDGKGFGCEIRYLIEEQPLGTAGSIGLLPARPSEPLLVMNGDLVTQVDISAMFAHHSRARNAVTVGVKPYTHEIPFGCVTIENHQITQLVEKPIITRMINGGIYILDPQVVESVQPNVPLQMTDLIESLLRSRHQVGSFELTGEWTDVGHWDSLDKARGS